VGEKFTWVITLAYGSQLYSPQNANIAYENYLYTSEEFNSSTEIVFLNPVTPEGLVKNNIIFSSNTDLKVVQYLSNPPTQSRQFFYPERWKWAVKSSFLSEIYSFLSPGTSIQYIVFPKGILWNSGKLIVRKDKYSSIEFIDRISLNW